MGAPPAFELPPPMADFPHEIATTRRVLERITDEHLGWKPHPKSMSLGGLALHVANLVGLPTRVVDGEGVDMAEAPPQASEPASRDEVLGRFDENAAAAQAALSRLDRDKLTEPWTLRRGAHVIFTLPKAAVLRAMGTSHIIHHRGQLSVYLRLLDLPVPSIYGPSADEQTGF